MHVPVFMLLLHYLKRVEMQMFLKDMQELLQIAEDNIKKIEDLYEI